MKFAWKIFIFCGGFRSIHIVVGHGDVGTIFISGHQRFASGCRSGTGRGLGGRSFAKIIFKFTASMRSWSFALIAKMKSIFFFFGIKFISTIFVVIFRRGSGKQPRCWCGCCCGRWWRGRTSWYRRKMKFIFIFFGFEFIASIFIIVFGGWTNTR
jgi:hypothetical protein